jgi:ABC-type sugar transport system substrate-binding protein
MKRLIAATLAAAALILAPTLPAHASVKWICNVPGEGDVTFVTAANAALHGINTANARAGQVFHDQFGEVCTVVSG